MSRDVDPVAVERAVAGESIRLGAAERVLVVATLTRAGWSINRIAEHLRVSHRTVSRPRRVAVEERS